MYNIIILSDQDISRKTGAAFSRMYEYARGLSMIEGTYIYISSLIINNTHPEPPSSDKRIFITGKESIRRTNFFLNRYFCFFRKKRQLQTLLKNFQGDTRNTVFIIYNFFSTFWEELFFLFYLKKQGYKVFAERNERSLGITLNTLYPKGAFKVVFFLLIKCFELVNSVIKDETVRFYDGVVVISTAYEKWLSLRNKNHLRVPILADTDLMHKSMNLIDKSNTFRIGYFGSISFNRDCVDVLIDAVSILVKELSQEVTLTIAGYGARQTIKLMNEKIDKLELSSNVKFIGYLNGENYFNVLKDQDIFVVLRRNNLQCKYGFSSKIAEYMALGKLVITTPVSDNNIYIRNNENGFIVDSTNPVIIAEKINAILNLPNDKIVEIKKQAKNTAIEHFNIDKYSDQLFNFLFCKQS